jgi:hypothetical protein
MSYGDDAGFETWMETMGYVLPSGAPDIAILRARGSAYIDATYEPLWTGTRTNPLSQDDAWPRTGATINCTIAIPDDMIPNAVINASYRAGLLMASEATTPVPLTGSRVKRQKADVLEREFFDDGKSTAGETGAAFVDPMIDGWLRQFICSLGDNLLLFESIGS